MNIKRANDHDTCAIEVRANMTVPRKHKIFSKIVVAVCVSLLTTGCSTTPHSIVFGKYELQLIPAISLQRIALAHAADEIVAIRIEGREDPVVVERFKRKDYVIVRTADGGEAEIGFSDVTALMIARTPKLPEKIDNNKGPGATAFASAAGEAFVYAPIVPLAIGTWPLLRVMGLDAAKNGDDNTKAGLIYRGLSRMDLLESVGMPKEKYACTLHLGLEGKPKVPLEIWVYDDSKVLRGGRTLSIDVDTGTVYHNSFHTHYFKDSNSFTCSQMAVQ